MVKNIIKRYKEAFSLYNLILALIISLCFVLSTRVVIGGGVWGTNSDNYVKEFGWKAIILFIVTLLLTYIIIDFVNFYLVKFIKKISIPYEYVNSNRLVKVWTIVNIVIWIPYYLSFYPGGIYSDTFASVDYYYNGILTNRHPLIYNFLIGMAIKLAGVIKRDLTWAFGFFFLIQMIVAIIELRYLLKWMINKKLNKIIVNVIMICAVFFPLIPLNIVSIWKDTPFCMAFLLWFIFFVDMLENLQKEKLQRGDLVKYVVGAFLVAFTRNNGKYIIALTMLFLVIMTLKRKYSAKKYFYSTILISTIAIFVIQGPVYNLFGVIQTDTVENYGIPLQQIGSVVANNGKITHEQKDRINNFIPYDTITEHFSPCLADNLKWYGGLNYDYMKSNQKEFLSVWKDLLISNPKIYIKEYILETVGFWDLDVREPDAYVQYLVWPNEMGVEGTDYFEKIFGFSFSRYVIPTHYISNALFFWLFVLSAFFCMKNYGFRKLLFYIPQFGIWLTLMIATPIAWSLRYVSGLVFTLPFIIIIPILQERKSEMN